ncbi:DUF2523 domain-containing protein [Vibrio splendidus]|uniref:DUF2523 domain-containing protein n=1 Tax=Vibrio splendidus TaxID=29497 RepID=UPI0024684290|nr:DUF2523 domain-containing protein [Vibrio splendidus]MDH5939868.1 DUF2523 domain-containing protein [Vibrio splendidus]
MLVFFEALGNLLENLFYRFLIGIGLSFTTYKSLDVLIETVKQSVVSQYLQLDSSLLNLLALTKIDEAITVIFSAFLAKMALKGFIAGSSTVFGFGGSN